LYIRRLCILVDSSYDTVSAPFTSPHLFSHFFLVFTASVYLYLQHMFTCIYSICLLVFTASVYLYLLLTASVYLYLLFTASVYLYLQHLFTCIYSICLRVFTASVYLYLQHLFTCIYSICLLVFTWSQNCKSRDQALISKYCASDYFNSSSITRCVHTNLKGIIEGSSIYPQIKSVHIGYPTLVFKINNIHTKVLIFGNILEYSKNLKRLFTNFKLNLILIFLNLLNSSKFSGFTMLSQFIFKLLNICFLFLPLQLTAKYNYIRMLT